MSRTLRATPNYDELFDVARKLGTAELLVELRRGRLWLMLVRRDDGEVIHQHDVSESIDAAAREIRGMVLGGHRRVGP